MAKASRAGLLLTLGGLLFAGLPMAAAHAERLDLATCVQLALSRNPELQDAQDASSAAQVGRRLALAEYHLKVVPTVDGGLRGSNTTDQSYQVQASKKLLSTGTQLTLSGGTSVFSAVPQVTVPYFTETRLTIAQPLLRGRGDLATRERLDDAERRISASHNAVVVTREEVVLEVVRRFYDVTRAAELGQVAEQSLTRVTQLGEAARAKLEIGAVSKMDVYRADLHAARLRNTMVEQGARRDASLDDLKLMLGLDPRVPVEIDARVQGPPASDVSGTSPEETALEHRFELREAREQVLDMERRLLLARHRLLPAVDLVGSYARQGVGDSFGDSVRLDRQEWTVGIRSSVSLDRTAEEVALAEAELALRTHERHYRVARDQVVRQVREATRQLDRARAQHTLAADVARQAEQQAELARFRYEKGVTDNLDLVQAEEQRAEAVAALTLGGIDQAVAAAVLRHVTGTLIEAFVPGGEPPVPPSQPEALEARPLDQPGQLGEASHATR